MSNDGMQVHYHIWKVNRERRHFECKMVACFVCMFAVEEELFGVIMSAYCTIQPSDSFTLNHPPPKLSFSICT